MQTLKLLEKIFNMYFLNNKEYLKTKAQRRNCLQFMQPKGLYLELFSNRNFCTNGNVLLYNTA